MARKRKTPPLTSWQKRNKAAQDKGYKNYYDYRKHDYGKRPPAEPTEPKSERGARNRGARGPAALRRALKKPDSIALVIEVPEQQRGGGQWTEMRYVITTMDARIIEYVIPLDDEDYDLDYWHHLIDEAEVEVMYYASAAGGE